MYSAPIPLSNPRPIPGIAPMAPLGPGVSRRNSNPRAGAFSPYDTHNIQTINTNGEQSIETFTLNSFMVLFKCKYGANIVRNCLEIFSKQ